MIRIASASAAERRMRGGMLSSPRPGNSISMAPIRANIRRYAAASAGRNDMSIVIAAATRDRRRRNIRRPHREAAVLLGGRLDGWQRVRVVHPSVETRASKSAIADFDIL